MNEPFEIPVTYKREELCFPARLLLQGYTHKFQVEVKGEKIFFERDEQGSYRAVVDPLLLEKNHRFDVALLQAIAEAIEDIVKQ